MSNSENTATEEMTPPVVEQQGEMSIDELIAHMDSIADYGSEEVIVTGDNVEELMSNSSDSSKEEDTRIEVIETETDTSVDGSKEDSTNTTSTEDADPSKNVETGTEEVIEDVATSHSTSTDITSEVSDDVTTGEDVTSPTDAHYERLLETLSKVTGTDVSELTPDMLSAMYKSAKGLTANNIQTPEEAMLQKHKLNTEDLALLAELKSGNVDAIKKFMVDQDINPYDVDLEEFDKEAFDSKLDSNSVNPIELKLNGLVSRAEATGVKEVVINDVLNWDESSVLELLDDADTSSILLSQIKDGSFNAIMEEVKRRDALDFTDSSSKTMMDKYSEASYSLANKKAKELNSTIVLDKKTVKQPQKTTNNSPSVDAVSNVEQTETDSTSNVQVVDNDARRKAAKAASTASTNITAVSTASSNTVVDINNMSDAELYKHMNDMIQ